LYAYGFRFYFTPLTGFFSPFPHGTGSLSVGREYLAFEDGPPMFRQDFTCLVLTLCRSRLVLSYTGLSPSLARLSRLFTSTHPITTTGLFPVRSPLLGESRLISFPPVTEMFQFTGFAPYTYEFSARYLLRGGFPHSEIAGSKLVCQLADTYRRLPRPSSPSTAKASAICAYSLDHITPRSLGIWS